MAPTDLDDDLDFDFEELDAEPVVLTRTVTSPELEVEAVEYADYSAFEDADSVPTNFTPQFIEELVDKIILFGNALTESPLHPYQTPFARRVIKSVIVGDGDVLTALASRQSGKTQTVGFVVSTLMVLLPRLATIYPDLLGKFAKGFWVGMFAPVETQAETLFSRTVNFLTSEQATAILGDPEIDDITARNPGVTKGIQLKKSQSLMLMMTANPRAKIESKTFHLIIIDEAQAADDFVISKCYSEDTPIWTPDGSSRTIKEIVENRLPVLSYDKPWDLSQRGGGRSRENRANPVDNTTGNLVGTLPAEWSDNGVQDVWRVTLSSGRSLEVTEDHRWVVRERRGNSRPHWCATKDLSVGMNVPLPTGAEFWGDRLGEDEGYFIGQMLGDGCLSAGSPVWCGMPDQAMDRMKGFAESFGTSMKINAVQPSGLHEVAFTKPGNGKNGLMAFLEGEGLRGLKGESKALVRDDYSRDFYIGWVSGLLDSDGCVTGKTAVFSNISERLVRQLSDVLLKLGVPNRVVTRKNSGSFGTSPKDLWEVVVRSKEGVARLAEVVDLRVPSKVRALVDAVDFHSTRSGRTSRHLEGVHWDRITGIAHVGKKQTYCVTVEPSNLLVANGVVCGNSINPMLAYTSGTMVLTGTPERHKGYFYKMIQLNKRTQTAKRTNHFQWDWREVAKVNKNYEKFIQGEKRRIGEDSDEFLLSYMCRWLLDRGMFITQTVFEALEDKSAQLVKMWHNSPVVVGIDPARKNDSTVVTVLWVDWDKPDEFGYFDHRILNWLEIQGDDWEDQYSQIINFLSAYDVLACAVDSNGVGDAVAQRLALLMPRSEIIPVTSSQVEQSKRYKHLQALVQRQLIGWPAHAKTRRLKVYQRFMQQMLDAEKKFSGQFFTVEAPDETGAHDDYVDSLSLAASLTMDMTMPEVQQSSSPFFGR